ncbi:MULTISPECIES: flagellin Hag [Bacillaceae]|uniref:Flagellin n=1 Tax=Evansella alkalicola TaxID=745819 RepID=A0ABS6JT22_9BACI|nr:MULTISPECIES: flagellin Hag [Bacillaceae]MBU9721723.1 flagellin Hag [Bacillus alkalicola]
MIINNNIPALNTHRQMGVNQNAMQNSMEKLSSGLRINRAGDDAAGIAISEKMRAQINGLDQASRNAQDGISLIQTAEGALDETHSILQRMRELAVQASNDTNVAVDRGEIQKEMDQLIDEIDRIAETTEFNTQNLLGDNDDGDFSGDANTFTFHIGANEGQNIELSIASMSSEHIGDGGDGDADSINDLRSDGDGENGALLTQTGADGAITTINNAIEAVSAERSNLGATQNRLEHTISNLDNASENLSAAESRIRDVDMAAEMMEMTRANILSQASQSMLAQANQQPQSVLQLLG